MKKNILLIAAILLLGLNSCKKEGAVTLDSKDVKQNMIERDEDIRALSRGNINVLDSFGILHNEVLEEVAQRGNISVISRQERFNLSVDIILEKSPSFDEIPTWGEMNQRLEFVDSLTKSNVANKVINKTIMTESERIVIEDLYNVIEDMKYAETVTTPDKFSDMLMIIETNILSSMEVEYDKTTGVVNNAGQLLIMCSVARHSYKFWYSAATDVSHPWHSVLDGSNNGGNGGENTGFGKIWGAIKFVAKDVWGGLTGPRVDPSLGIFDDINAGSTAFNAAMASIS